MTNQYLSIVLRNKFNLFYRFGYTFIPKSELILFDGTLTKKVLAELDNFFDLVTPFEYDEEYLVLHFESKENNITDIVELSIKDLIKIYPLSRQAKASIESKIDPRIKLEEPIFESNLLNVESRIEKREIERAIEALWNICKIQSSLDRYLSNIGKENIFNGLLHRRNGVKASKIEKGSYWEYLIAYDRFDYFPNSTLGYFYDAGQVFANSVGLDTFEGSSIHQSLEKLNRINPSVKFHEIINFLESDEGSKVYVGKTTTDKTKIYVIAPLYLMLRNEIRNSEDISETNLLKNLDYLKRFEESFFYTVVLLGAFFGFRKFYDAYYNSLNLRFFKSYQDLNIQHHNENLEPKELKVESRLNQTSLDEENLSRGDKDLDEGNEKEMKVSIEEVNIEPKGVEIEKANTVSKKLNKDTGSKEIDLYKSIIEHAFLEKPEIKLTELGILIKKKTGLKKITNAEIKKIIKQIPGIEIVPKKSPEIARKIEEKGNIQLSLINP